MRTIAFAAIVTFAVAFAPDPPAASPSAAAPTPAAFVTAVGQAGLMEIESGALAQKNSSNAGVQTFGYLMITNHSLLNEDLERIAKKQHIPFPTSVSASQQQMLNQLKPLKGKAFDSMYLSDMIAGHQGAVSLFESEKTASDPELKAYAEKHLPMVKEHLRLAQALQSQGQ
jgi:putative membrane protein